MGVFISRIPLSFLVIGEDVSILFRAMVILLNLMITMKVAHELISESSVVVIVVVSSEFGWPMQMWVPLMRRIVSMVISMLVAMLTVMLTVKCVLLVVNHALVLLLVPSVPVVVLVHSEVLNRRWVLGVVVVTMLIMVGLIIMLCEFVVIVMRVLLIMFDGLNVLVSVMRESVTHELIEVAIVRLILAPKLS